MSTLALDAPLTDRTGYASMMLRVRSITYEAEGILSFELVDPSGGSLPRFDAGAHVEVGVPGEALKRRYSLCGSPSDTRGWRIAVLKAANSRGGSRALHEKVRAGDLIEVKGPYNFFPLHENAGRTVLLAGGIGVTPLLPMLERLHVAGQNVEFHYCTQTPERTAFIKRLEPFIAAGIAHIHHDGGDPGNRIDIAQLLKDVRADTHLYYCGPAGFMESVRRASGHWPEGTVHFEFFGAEPVPATVLRRASVGGVEVRLVRSGRTIIMQPTQTMLQALRDAGIACESSCEAGLCGTCKVGFTGGPPEHNDLILSDEERASQVVICCAHAVAPLSLDI